jgi:apolipoprotein N-acyltransferase
MMNCSNIDTGNSRLRHLFSSSFVMMFLGGTLLAVSNGRWIFPLLVWIAPILLMRSFRSSRQLWKAILGLWTVFCVATPVAWFGLWPFPPLVMAKIVTLGSVWAVMPYLVDRLVLGRLPSPVQCVVFPSAVVAIEFTRSLSTHSTWGNLAYTQTENLPLLQFASISGIWGISFLILLLAPIANSLWSANAASRGTALRQLAAYGALLAAVLVYGRARMTLSPPNGNHLRAAMISPPELMALDSEESILLFQNFQKVFTKQAVDTETLDCVTSSFAEIEDELFGAIEMQAQAGAEVIVLSEAALISFSESHDQALVTRAQQLAKTQGIYLGLAIAKVPSNPGEKNENRLLLVDPSGAIVQTYWKHQTIPVVEEPYSVPGSADPLAYHTDKSVFGGVICYDLDSPRYLQGAGAKGIDVMLAPTGDWPAIKDIHARMATMRAVEQGFSLLRPANHGISLAVDYQGRTCGRMDHYTASDYQLASLVPRKGVTTIYTKLGDILPWMCVIFSLFAIGTSALKNQWTWRSLF